MLSTKEFSRKTGFALVCPITATIRGWPLEVVMAKGSLPAKAGALVDSAILTDQVKSLDFRKRGMTLVARAPDDVLEEALAKVRAIFDFDDRQRG